MNVQNLKRLLKQLGLIASIVGIAGQLHAAVFTKVTLDTASLVADSADMPYSLFVQFNSGGTNGVSNNATLSQFNFNGGSPGASGTIATTGSVGANSNLSTAISLSTAGGAFSSFDQDFTPGSSLTFVLNTTQESVDASINTPDVFVIQILDSAGNPLPTLDPSLTNTLLTITYSSPLDIEPFASDSSQSTTGGGHLNFAAPILSPVPEPVASGSLVLIGFAAIARRTRRS